jgi:uncharacterized protein (TIGR04255 family)
MSAVRQSEARPDFDSPPVIETVLSVQFHALKELAVPHFGLFWQQIRETYPNFQVQPPLNATIEKFDGQDLPQLTISVEGFSSPPVRCWFITKDGMRVLQIQNDRFIYNWRKTSSDDDYPRYESLRLEFGTEWQKFCKFLEGEHLGVPEPNQCEMTYINHLEQFDNSGHPIALGAMFPCWTSAPSGRFLPDPITVACTTVYEMPDYRGRLYIEFKPAIRHADGKRIIVLTLTARGAPAGPTITDVVDWFDLGREWIVRGFADFTSEALHKQWGRR